MASTTGRLQQLGACLGNWFRSARDGGAAALINGMLCWTFGDTLMTVTGVDGFNYRSSTAAWGLPGQLVPICTRWWGSCVDQWDVVLDFRGYSYDRDRGRWLQLPVVYSSLGIAWATGSDLHAMVGQLR